MEVRRVNKEDEKHSSRLTGWLESQALVLAVS